MIARRVVRRTVVVAAVLAVVVGTGWPALAQKPDAELKGITVLGVVVEELGSQAVGCGLNQAAIEQTVTKVLTDGGLKVVRNTDEDTYFYVNVNSVSAPGGLCVTRYDVALNTHTMAKLSYQTEPVLVEVSLLHAGGLAGGSAPGHAESVIKNVRQYAEQFLARMKAANGR